MSQTTEYVIEGQMKSFDEIDFSEARLAASAFIEGSEVACSEVDDQGCYRLEFEHGEQPPAAEVRLMPARDPELLGGPRPALTEILSPDRFVAEDDGQARFHATHDPLVPGNLVGPGMSLAVPYRIRGNVYAADSFFFGVLHGARIEFFEVDPVGLWVAGEWIDGVWVWHDEPPPKESYLGTVDCDPSGSYDFTFQFAQTWGFWPQQADFKPDVRARIHQFVDGQWERIFESKIQWDIGSDLRRDFVIDRKDTYSMPAAGSKPRTGFRFSSVGLLPIDSSRIDQGYATAKPGDPARIRGISHQPFCGILRMFGLFADQPKKVTTFRAQIAEANANGVTGSFKDLTDPLHNRKWDAQTRTYQAVVLGPDPTTGQYRNIDIDSALDWHEHALKVTWNTTNVPNGYYALRIIGFDANGKQVATQQMPVLRIDNSRPQASIKAVAPQPTPCGALTLGTNRKISFSVTASDPEGHVLEYALSGTRGQAAQKAGPNVGQKRPSSTANWQGVGKHTEEFVVHPRQGPTATCSTMAYNFELHVWGSATDGYNVRPNSQRVSKEANLVISE